MQAPPKFSSFVKKPASSAPTPEEGPNAGNARRQHDSRDDRRSHRRRLQDQQQSRRRDAKEEHGLRLKKASPADTPYNWSTTAKQEPPLGNDLYVVDIKGDAGNTTYDGPDKASIPAYRPVPERRAIGYRVVRPPPAKSLLSTLSRNERTRLRQIDPQLKSMSEAAASRNIERDFISLAAGTKRRRLGQQDPHLPTDDLSEGTGSESERSSEDVVPDGVSKSLNSWDGHDLSEAKAENARLSRLVQLHPQDAQAWQVFIDYQEKWMEASPTHQGPRAASSRAIADLRISLYTDALAKLGETHPARASFILKLLEEGGKVWERAKLMDRWEDTIMREADSVEIQMGYLNAIQCHGYDFDRCRQQYIKYLRSIGMRTIAERAERQVYALLRFTSAARDAGFIELAQNIWQGLLEYNFDIEPGGTEARRLQRVEELWAKEAPKIGDPVERRVPESQTMSPCILQQSSSSIAMHGQASSLWANQEIRLSRQQVDGGGGAENVEDPFSIILFQDIEPFLFTITSDKALLLIDGLLTFYGLPLLANDAPSPASHWQADPFVLHLLRGTSIATEVFGERTTSKTTPTTLFSRQHHCWKTDHATFIRQVLDTLLRRLQACPELTALAEYYMALMAHSFPNEARQAAKNILKRVPLNLRLYHAMGLVEALLGNNEAADKISASALDMCGRLPEAQRDDEALLRLSWVWQAIDRQDGPDALSRLREASQGAPAFEKLIQSRDQALQHGRYYQACAYSEMLALEPYLVHDFDLRNALAAFQDEMEHLASSAGSSAFGLELLHQARALLVQHHVRQFKHFSPIQIRDALRQSVLQFPANTLFLRLFMENEARFIIDDRIRSSTRDVVLSQEEPSLVTYLAYIQHEIRSIESFGVTQHSIRTRLEQALSSRCGKCSQGLWMEYFFFELLVAKDLRRAKAVFYRGFESVPWSKQFALLAFEHLAVVFEEDELREVHGLMQHRGLRLWSEYMEAK